MLRRQIHLERGLLMKNIIARVYEIIKETHSLIEFEEQVQLLMHDTFSTIVGEAFTELNKVMKQEKQAEGWTVERNDSRSFQSLFGDICFTHTLMYDENKKPRYPFSEWIGLRPNQKQSPLVEVKVAELASNNNYRESARILEEWSAVKISHTSVGNILKRVGMAQAEADKEMIAELEESAELPQSGKEMDYLYAEADGVYVRSTKKKKHIEVSHALIYEGWDKNGKRVSLKNPLTILTTEPIDDFWQQTQTIVAHQYKLDQTQIVTNSDGGAGYAANKFQDAFSQSTHPIIHQLDEYHIQQAINRTFGFKKCDWKKRIQETLKKADLSKFTLYLDTYESMLEEEKQIEKVKSLRSYIINHWEYITDWRTRLPDHPMDARGLGAMESNQRKISFRMKKRGMHWSREGAEAMVKVKQGMENKTLREVYLTSQTRSYRKQRKTKQMVRMSSFFKKTEGPSFKVRQGSVSLYAAHSSAVGRLFKTFT